VGFADTKVKLTVHKAIRQVKPAMGFQGLPEMP
jgi:hypothetical protein